MNKKQAAYQTGRGIYNGGDVIFLAMAAKYGYDSVYNFLNSQIALGIINASISIYAGFYGLISGVARGLTYLDLKKIIEDRKSYPLEHSESVVIDDFEGLQFLLAKTRHGEEREWGTLLKAHDDKGRAVIYDVLDISTGKEIGLIGKGKRTSITFEATRANEEGYKGCHHYHPDFGPRWLGARNFSIGFNDRYSPLGWINLLTFNLPEGPEIVGFNRRYTYIPTDVSKRELVRANPRQVMKYLHA